MTMPTRMQAIQRVLTAALAAAVLAGTGAAARQDPPPQPRDLAQLLATRSCPNCFLANAVVTAEKFEGADLQFANLVDATLYMVVLKDANLTGANLQGAKLRKTDLTGATLTGADLTGADLTFAIGANFSGAITTATTTCPGGMSGPCA